MNTPNSVLMTQASESLRGKWGLAIATFLILVLFRGCLSYFLRPIGGLVGLFINGNLGLGVAIFSLAISRGQEARPEMIFEGFKDYSRILLAYLLMIIYVIAWSLLLIIPGIIAAISYSMTFYILAENPQMTGEEAITQSKKMMEGYKMKYFGLCLLFFLLSIACIFTLFIGFLWLFPFINVTNAKFYDDIKPVEEPLLITV